MSINKPQNAVNKEAAAAAAVEAAEVVAENAPVEEKGADVIEQVSQETAVSTHVVGTAVAVGQQNAALVQLAEAGYEGLAIDFNSFPNITLKDGEFNISSGGIIAAQADKGFEGRITATKSKFAVRIKTTNEDEADVVFTPNKLDVNDPTTIVGAKVAEWKADGFEVEVKDYIDCFVMVEIVHDDNVDAKNLEGQLVVCSIPKTSIGRLTGFLATQAMKHKQSPDQFLTRFTRGTKVTAVQYPFYPWDFKKGSEG